MRKIDADALKEELSTLTMTITGLRAGKGVLHEWLMEYRKSVLRIIDEAPTIESEPVQKIPCKMQNTDFRTLCQASGMTQKAFSEYFGIPVRTIENWATGKRQCPDYLLDLMEFKLRTVGKIQGTAFITLIEPEKDIEWTEN